MTWKKKLLTVFFITTKFEFFQCSSFSFRIYTVQTTLIYFCIHQYPIFVSVQFLKKKPIVFTVIYNLFCLIPPPPPEMMRLSVEEENKKKTIPGIQIKKTLSKKKQKLWLFSVSINLVFFFFFLLCLVFNHLIFLDILSKKN